MGHTKLDFIPIASLLLNSTFGKVLFFGTEKQVISSKTFTLKTQLKNIYRKRLALVLEFENGFIKFPLTHGNAYQGSGRTLSFKCMFKY